MRPTLAMVGVLVLSAAAAADVIKLKNGGTLEGVVLREADGSVVVRLKYATVTLDRADIESIEKKPSDPEPAAAPDLRLSKWDACLEKLVALPWAADLRQIPATVVDKGVLKHVPYMSHKAGNYEFNLYGDPDRPTCLEIGVYKDLLKSADAKKNCLDLMASLVAAKDAAVLKVLDLAKDRKEADGLVFEVTPETADDAYGGWWISIYDPKAVELARATEEELKEITVAEEDLEDDEPKKADPRKPEPKKLAAQPRPVQETVYVFRRPEMQHARSVVRKGGHGRRIYVRGIHRPRGGVYRPGVPRGGIRR